MRFLVILLLLYLGEFLLMKFMKYMKRMADEYDNSK